MKIFIFLIIYSLCILPYQLFCQAYKPTNQLAFDLDKDGEPEIIKLVRHKKLDGKEELLHLEVYKTVKGRQKPLWKDRSRQYEFYQGDLGFDELDCIGDIFENGDIIMASTAAQSDISPSWIKFYKWTPKGFEIVNGGYVYGKTLDMKSPEKIDSLFSLTIKHSENQLNQDSALVWIYKFRGMAPGGGVYAEAINSGGYSGIAKFRKTGNGWKAVQWLKPFSAPLHP